MSVRFPMTRLAVVHETIEPMVNIETDGDSIVLRLARGRVIA
jgi:hypothetical protein